ncbi:ABC transporter ATP-binding protein [Flavihumibacter stibioxidans]|uniref:ABC transporter ATP-binding protein n=2 Tax=Flavihumibacter stibioxidans TaxID=1834163 RepID=A0ABR7M5F3_9BACT|nr:ABC transporter ATP-binding protein [Flavihumibacter stibioxidans]
MDQGKGNMEETVISIRNLHKSFGNNVVLKGFNLDLKRGENLAVLGKSGSGKSVLIKCIIGLLAPDGGTINVLGQSIPDLSQDELDRTRVRIGFLFQSNALYDSMTVKENLEFPMRRHWLSADEKKAEEKIAEALENVGLLHTLNMMPVELSGGMRKRIALARTLILKPDIILYDEPTTGLDPITAREISTLMNNIQKKYNTSSIIISHDMNCIKITADRIIILMNGRAYAEGTYDELVASADPEVKQFFD